MDSAGLKEQVLARAAAEPALTRAELRRRSLLVTTLALSASLLVFLAAGGVRIGDRPPAMVATTLVGALLLATIGAWGALGRGHSMLGRPRRLLLALIVIVPLALLSWKLVVSHDFAGMMRIYVERPGWRCLRWSLLIGIGPLAALIGLRRGSEPMHPVTSGAAIGVAAGAGAWAMIDLWCPVAYPPHLLLGHVLPIVLLAVVGAVLGGRLLGVGR